MSLEGLSPGIEPDKLEVGTFTPTTEEALWKADHVSGADDKISLAFHSSICCRIISASTLAAAGLTQGAPAFCASHSIVLRIPAASP